QTCALPIYSLRREFMGDENPLSGRKVAIIGPSFRKEVYKELVEGLGGRFLFAPSEEKLSAIDRAMSKADGVIFITTYTSHKANDHVKAAEERYQVPVVPVNVTGLDALRDAILNMLNPIMEHRETA